MKSLATIYEATASKTLLVDKDILNEVSNETIIKIKHPTNIKEITKSPESHTVVATKNILDASGTYRWLYHTFDKTAEIKGNFIYNKDDESIKIYNELFFKNKYYLAAFEIAYKLVNSNQDYELALKVWKDVNSDDSLIKGYKGFVYEKLEMYDKAE